MRPETDLRTASPEQAKKVKCLVWDLDNTLWNGVLLEDSEVQLKERVREIIRIMDERGILQSIASRNDSEAALSKLKEFGIDEYFIYPQINWNSKSTSIKNIACSINIGLDTMAFIDDQLFEREEVRFRHPEVRCFDAADVDVLTDVPDLMPAFLTEDSRNRRQMYRSDCKRKEIEASFEGTAEEFLASLNMILTISTVAEEDLQRAEELTIRTHQLNATGYTYSYEELDCLRRSGNHKLWIAELEDKYGSYGKIGLALIECGEADWTLKLLLMSCRVMSRGVGSIMLNLIIREAMQAGVALAAEFVPNDRNRMMYVTYKFAGFQELGTRGPITVLAHNPERLQPLPDYVTIRSSIG